MDRRTLVMMLAVGAADVLAAACSPAGPRTTSITKPADTATPAAVAAPRRARWSVRPADNPVRPLPPIPGPHPGSPAAIFRPPVRARQVALTIDDGYSPETVAGYVEFAERSGIPITFSPNGTYQQIWNPHAPVLRRLIEAGQVQIGNHTYTHRNMLYLGDRLIRDDIERNEAWIQATFGITARPWFRPPYGARNARTDAVAGELGFTHVLMWNGSFGDSLLLRPDVLLAQARRYLQPGTIVLGHANHPTILRLFAQIEKLIAERRLQPVTLDTMFHTSRAVG